MRSEDLEGLLEAPTPGQSLRCCINLGDLMGLYEFNAKEAGVQLLTEENDASVFFSDRRRWDPGLGSSWKEVLRDGGEKDGRGLGSKQEGVSDHEDRGFADEEPSAGLSEQAEAPMGPKKKRKRPRGPGSKASRNRHGKDLKQHGSNAASREARLADKWIRLGASFRTETFSLAKDGSHSSSGWQGIPPPAGKRREVQQAYDDGSVVQILGSFFPIPYQP
jgi:hypothetical protein